MAMELTDYPGRTARRYVLTYAVPDVNRKIMFDPAAFYFGHFRRLTRQQRREALCTWQQYWGQGNHFPRLFDVPFVQRTYTNERNGNGYKREEQDLLAIPLSGLERAIQREIRAKQSRKFKAAHLWNGEGDDELFKEMKLHTGSIVSSASVRSDSSARNADVPKHRLVTINDLFGAEGHYITCASSPSEDFMWAETKEGRTNVVVVDKHLAAVMDLARHRPELFQGYTPEKGTAFLPFDFTASFKHEGVHFREPEHFPGTVPPRDVLLMDIFMYWLFHGENGATQFDISKKLMQMHFLMDPSVVAGIKDGQLKPEVLTQGQATPAITQGKRGIVRKMYSEIHKQLTSDGYALDGYTLEFGNSAYETIAFNYVGMDGSARVLFHPNYKFPPLIVYKKEATAGKALDHFGSVQSPINYLARPHISIDDWIRKKADTVVEVPTTFIPAALFPDYKEAIAAQYEGGIAAFRNNVTARYMYGTAVQKAMGRKLLALVKE